LKQREREKETKARQKEERVLTMARSTAGMLPFSGFPALTTLSGERKRKREKRQREISRETRKNTGRESQ
jgi:hypothetical protein